MTRFGIQRTANARHPDPAPGRPKRRSAAVRAWRLRALPIGFTVVASLYALRLGHLQIVQADELRARSIAQSAEYDTVPAPRGGIYDRNGASLAADDTRYEAYLAPAELSTPRAAAIEAISGVVSLTSERRTALERARRGWAPVAAGLTAEERAHLERNVARGLHFQSTPARAYPRGSVARRLIGRIDREGRGATGLEEALDAFLTGTPGRLELRRDGHQNTYRPPRGQFVEPRPGMNVLLTIDAELQRIAETELARAIEQRGASAGDMVILEPRTGELLAVASERPGVVEGEVPAFTDAYEPGSTLKPFLLAALMSEGEVDLDEMVDTEGGVLTLGRRTIRDVHGSDSLSIRDIILHSSNVGAAKLAARVSPTTQYTYLRDFGFGRLTFIEELHESSGQLQRPDDWTSLSAASHAMGYEISTTSLQLALAYGALANGGRVMRPRIIKEIRTADGRIVRRAEPEVVRQVVSPEVARAVSDVLADVVRNGTATLAHIPGLSVAGKTGTARIAADGGYAQGRYRASFVGFAPADDPRVVILTRLEDPTGGSYYGGAIAAPASQAALQAALTNRGATLDPRMVVMSAEPRPWDAEPRPWDAAPREERGPFIFAVGGGEEARGADDRGQGAVTLPDLTGLAPRAAAARLHELGLRVEWSGRGIVKEQVPAPGATLDRGAKVRLR